MFFKRREKKKSSDGSPWPPSDMIASLPKEPQPEPNNKKQRSNNFAGIQVRGKSPLNDIGVKSGAGRDDPGA